MANKHTPWAANESEMGELISAKDWSETSLGAMEDWPQSLRSALKMCLASNSPISICWGDDLIFLYNDAWKELIGDPHPSPLGQPAEKVFKSNWENFNSCFKQVLTTGEVVESPNQFKYVAGDKEYYLDFSFSPIPDEDGSFGGVFNITKEIKAQKDPEKSLRGLRENADSSIGLHWIDPDGTIVNANQAELDMLGYSREEYVGNHISDFHADQDKVEEILAKSSEGVELHDYECRLKCNDGSIRHVLLSSDFHTEGGESVHTRFFVRDITDRKKAGAELMRKITSSGHDEGLFYDSVYSRDFIYIFDLNYRLLFVNDALLDFWERSLKETIGKNLFEVGYEPWHAEMHEREIERVIDTRQPVQGELSFRHERVGQRIYDYSFAPVLDDKGEVEAVAGSIRDITEHKQTERALRKSEEKYRALFETMDKGICIIKVEFDEDEKPVDWHYLEVNKGYEKQTGLYNVAGKKASEVLPGSEENLLNTYGKVAQTGEPAYYEGYIHELEGWFDISAYPINDPQERKIAVLVNNITERKQKELTDALLSAIVEGSDDAIISKDLDSIITSWNDGAERIFGYTAEEAIGQPITLIFPEDRMDEEDEIIRRIRRGERIDHFETKRKCKDGTLLDISLTISPIKDSDGNIVGASKIARDITDRKKHEFDNAWLSAIVKCSDDAIISKDLDSIITSWNESAERIFGYTAEEAVGQPITLIFPEDRIDEEDEIISRIRRGERIDHFETKRKRKDGSLLDVSLTISPIKNTDGNVVGASKIARDVTKRKEHELTESWLSAIVEGSEDAIISKDLDSIITSWNESAERMFGYTAEEAIGQPVTMLFPEDRLDEEIDIINRIRKGERVNHFETKRERKDGSLLDVSLTISPIKDSDGNVVGASKIARDITKRKEAEQKLEAINESLEERVKERTKKLRSYQQQLRSLASQLNKAEEQERQRLASELHDRLGQMLAVAKMKTDGLQHGNLPEILSNEMEELKKVVDNALKYNQNLMSELKPPPVLDKEDVTEVILWTVKQVEKQGLNIDIKNDGQPKRVEKELRTTLHQSVRELLQNVLKHADTNEARVTVSAEQGDVKVTVEDNGKGFDLTEDQALTPTEHGGFGLFNIKERMDWHGGSFEIESKSGEGTKATLYAPLKEKEKRPAEEEIIPPSQKEEIQEELQQKIKVLLVDDHEMMRRGLRQMIEKQDDLIVAEEASNGKQAVELARESSPHIIIMDVNMPVMDGIEATRKIKAEMPNVRVIGLSLHDSSEVIQDMKEAGASDYLIKNEAFESLIATIRAEISASEEINNHNNANS